MSGAPTTTEVARLLAVRYETARALCWVAVAFDSGRLSPAAAGHLLQSMLEAIQPPPADAANGSPH